MKSEHQKNLSASLKAWWANPENRARMLKRRSMSPEYTGAQRGYKISQTLQKKNAESKDEE